MKIDEFAAIVMSLRPGQQIKIVRLKSKYLSTELRTYQDTSGWPRPSIMFADDKYPSSVHFTKLKSIEVVDVK